VAERAEAPVDVVARIGALGVYATSAQLVAWRRHRPERVIRTALTFGAALLVTPFGFFIPPHLEPAAVVFLTGLYFTRRAWIGEWQAVSITANCPRCDAPVSVRRGTVLFLPHTLTCSACKAEVWLELGEAPDVAESDRRSAQERARAPLETDPDAVHRPPLTWSPAASNWRDRPRDE
jgi:hypothetical protein